MVPSLPSVVEPVPTRLPRLPLLPLVSGAALACLVAPLVGRVRGGAVLPLLAVLGGLLLIPNVLAALERRWTAFHPVVVFGGFCFAGYFLRSLHLLWYQDLDLYHILVDRTAALELLGHALTVVIVGVLAFYFGYLSPGGAAIAARLPLPPARWSAARVRAVTVIFTTIGAVSYFLYARQSGGLLFLVTNMEMRSELAAGMHLYYFGIRFLELGLLFRYANHLRSETGVLRRLSLAVHALLVMGFVSTLGSRSWAMEVLFMMLVIRTVLFRAPRARVLALIIAGAVLVFSIYDQYRNLTYEGVEAGELREIEIGQVEAIYLGVLGHRNFDMMDNLLSLLHYTPDRLPYLLGGSYAHYFVNWIPRRWWVGKPKGVDSVLAERIYGWGMGGAPPGTIGELWMNFQWAGVIAGMALFGALCRLIRAYSGREPRHPFLALAFGAALVFVGMVTRGSFFQVGTVFTMRLLPMILASLWVASSRSLGGTSSR